MALLFHPDRVRGRVEVCDGTFVETVLARGWIESSQSFLVLGPDLKFPIPSHETSLVAAYCHSYGVAGVFVSLAASVIFEKMAVAFVAPLFLGLVLYGLSLGHLSEDEVRRRRVFRTVTGHAANPALLAYGIPQLAEHLRLDLERRRQGPEALGYRAELAHAHEAPMIDGELDPAYLALSMTLARIEGDTVAEQASWRHLSPITHKLPQSIVPVTALASVAPRE